MTEQEQSLRQTLSYLLGAYKHSSLDTEEVVAGIEKAFREAGYISPEKFDKLIEKNADFNKRWNLMTGQEWLSRFEAEAKISKPFPKELLNVTNDRDREVWRANEIADAAYRASGVDHE